jgi:hypothetical protein
MQQTQTINLNVTNTPAIPDTALAGLTHWLNTNYVSLILIATLAILAILATIFLFKHRKPIGKILLTLATVPSLGLLAQATTYPVANATSVLQLTNPTLDITVYKDDANTANPLTKTTITTTTVITDNQTGYTMSAKLDQALTNDITMTLNDQTLTTNPVNVYNDNTGTSPSANDNTLTLSLPGDIQLGTYSLDIIYDVIEHAPIPQVACVSGSQFKGNIGDIRNAATITSTWAIGDTGIATDQRNNQEYCIGKLADDKVWMLDNLKLELGVPNADTTKDTTVLEPENTNVDTNTPIYFTQDGTESGVPLTGMTGNFTTEGNLTINGNTSWSRPNYDAWRQTNPSDPTRSDTINCRTNDGVTYNVHSKTGCGYLYNYYTATASSDPQASYPASITSITDYKAPYSICPAGWKLPSGYVTVNDIDNDLPLLSAKMNNPNATTGSIDTTLSGGWNSGFGSQGEFGAFWSSSVFSSYYAFLLYFRDGYVSPYDLGLRYYGFGVRCVFSS